MTLFSSIGGKVGPDFYRWVQASSHRCIFQIFKVGNSAGNDACSNISWVRRLRKKHTWIGLEVVHIQRPQMWPVCRWHVEPEVVGYINQTRSSSSWDRAYAISSLITSHKFCRGRMFLSTGLHTSVISLLCPKFQRSFVFEQTLVFSEYRMTNLPYPMQIKWVELFTKIRGL